MNLNPYIKRHLLFAAFFLLCCTAFGQDKIDGRLQADTYFRQKNYDAAAAAYTNLIRSQKLQDTAMARIYLLRGESYWFLKEYDKAQDDYTVSIKLSPNNYNVFWDRGILHEANGRHSKAINDYYEALRFLPVSDTLRKSTLYSYIAFNQYQQHDLDSTLKNDSIAISLYQRNSRAYASSGFAYANRNNFLQAIVYYTKAIRYYTDFTNTKYLSSLYGCLGDVRRLQKQYKEAINDYSSALKLNPDDRIAYWNRGATYHYHKDYELATADYTKAMSYYQDDKKQLAFLYEDRAQNERGQWLLTKAIQDDSTAIKIIPSLFNGAYIQNYHLQLAATYLQNGNYQRSIEAIKSLLDMIHVKYEWPLYEQMAISEYFLKNFNKAIDYSSISISLSPHSSLAYYYRGKAYLKDTDKRELAIKDFNKAIAIDTSKKSSGYLFSLFYTGRGDEAADILQKQLITADDNIQLVNDYYSLARLYSLMSKPEDANNYLKLAIDSGFAKKYAEDDDDLDNIRNTSDYKSIMNGSNQITSQN